MSNGARILWVDDEIDLLKPHILFLKGKGYDVETANNAYDAIDLVASHPFDLIILDEMMPGMTGLETLPKIKEIRPTTPVIMVTKSEEENIMDKAVGSKIADYLIKPVNPNQVLLSIKKNVHSQQLVTEQSTADYRSQFGEIASRSVRRARSPTGLPFTKKTGRLGGRTDRIDRSGHPRNPGVPEKRSEQ